MEGEIDLSRYLKPLARRWPLLLAVSLIGGTIGLLISARRPVLYEASTTVLVQQSGAPMALSTARALLRNYTLAAETVGELGLGGEPYLLTPQRFVDGVLTVDELGGTQFLRVKVKLPDAELAARASHLLSAKAVELNRRLANEGNAAVRSQLKGLLEDTEANLRAAEKALLDERSRAQVDLLKKDTEVLLDNRADYRQLLIDIEVEKSQLAAAQEEIAAQPPLLTAGRAPAAEDALRRASQPPDGGRVPPKAPSRAAANPDALDLSNPVVNPVYQTLAFQIATSRTRLAGMERQRREMAAVHGSAQNQLKPFSDLYRSEMEVARLENEYDLAKQAYSELALRYEQSRAESVGNMMRLQIVDPAMPPERPVSRRRLEAVAAGLVGGFLLAVVLVLATSREPRAAAAISGSDAAALPRS